MNDKKLCEWLRANSSGTYQPSAEAADRIEQLLAWIEDHGNVNDTCTKPITGTICGSCKCSASNT